MKSKGLREKMKRAKFLVMRIVFMELEENLILAVSFYPMAYIYSTHLSSLTIRHSSYLIYPTFVCVCLCARGRGRGFLCIFFIYL